MRRPLRIGLLGPLCDNDVVMAEYFKRLGVECVVFRPIGMMPNLGSAFYQHVEDGDVRYFRSPLELASAVTAVDYLFAFSGVFPMWLGKYRFLYPLLKRLGWPRFATIGTGSSLTEAIAGNSLRPLVARFGLRTADINIVNNYPHAIKNIVRYKISNVVFLPFPFVQPDPKAVSFDGSTSSVDYEEDFILFHPSHLDWGKSDNSAGRNSTKGNDRFIRAFSRLVKDHHVNARLVILDRGPDRVLARKLVCDLGMEKSVTWRKELSRDEYLAAARSSDVVVDQFDVGGFGGIAWEAMCLGKPVLGYINQECNELAYWGVPPILNAHTEDEILETLLTNLDKSNLTTRGDAILDWASLYSWQSLAAKFLVYAEIGSGRRHFSYGVPLRDLQSPDGGVD
jgi:glycosyltransferase involved in cell wall biosynthesis